MPGSPTAGLQAALRHTRLAVELAVRGMVVTRRLPAGAAARLPGGFGCDDRD